MSQKRLSLNTLARTVSYACQNMCVKVSINLAGNDYSVSVSLFVRIFSQFTFSEKASEEKVRDVTSVSPTPAWNFCNGHANIHLRDWCLPASCGRINNP